MTKQQIDDILDRVRKWPMQRQEDAAAILLRLEQQGTDFDISAEEWADLEEALAEAEREEPVPDAEIKALFDRFRLP